MSNRALIASLVALGGLGFGMTGVVHAQSNPAQSNPAMSNPATTAPPERMIGTSTTDNPATAATPRPGSPAAMSTPGTASPNAVPGLGTPGDTTPSNAAGAGHPDAAPSALVPGANSFTEGEARSRIQDRGFAQVSALKLDNQGIWRGQATRDGKNVGVALDYQGHVVER